MNNLEKIYKQVAEEKGLSFDTVRKIYSLYWKCIMEHYKDIPLDDDSLTEKQLLSYKTYIRLPKLGTFYIPYDKWKRRRYQIHIMEDKMKKGLLNSKFTEKYYGDKKNKTNVHKDCDNNE